MAIDQQNLIIPVILAGGTGSRLWPISTEEKPKQFCNLIGSETLFQSTLKRLIGYPFALDPIVICNYKNINLVKAQSSQINVKLMGLISEPFGRNTAPAVTIAALTVDDFLKKNLSAKSMQNDPIILILPSDHAIKDLPAFQQSIASAHKILCEEHNKIICFGVIPTHPETGYGYIKIGNKLQIDGQLSKAHFVDCFVEKPHLELAKQYLASEKYFWNSGMLMFRKSTLLHEMQNYSADIFASCQEILKCSSVEDNILYLCRDSLALCRSESVDKAVMEHTDKAIVVPLNVGWSDLGSFAALENYLRSL